MKKTIWDQQAVDEIIERVNKLTPESPAQWGAMNVVEMLLHCTLANKFIQEDESPYRKPTIKEWVLKKLCIFVIPRLPRNRKGPKRLRTKDKINVQDFLLQRQAFIETISLFPDHEKPLRSIHFVLGYLNRNEWGIMAWMHMDHHLRQFGV